MPENLEVLTEKIIGHMDAFKSEAPARVGGNKAAGARARKSTNHLTKLMKQWRKLSVQD